MVSPDSDPGCGQSFREKQQVSVLCLLFLLGRGGGGAIIPFLECGISPNEPHLNPGPVLMADALPCATGTANIELGC